MNILIKSALALMFAIGVSQLAMAKEHGGAQQEQPGQEHGGAATATEPAQEHGGAATPSADQIRKAVEDHVNANLKDGNFEINDPKTGQIRKLKLVRVHDRVGKTGNYYYSCTDMQDVGSGDLLDLDYDVAEQGGTLTVVDVRIHKDNGVPRYTYDENDNRIPVEEVESDKGSPAGEHGGEGVQEHGGETHKEHGGN